MKPTRIADVHQASWMWGHHFDIPSRMCFLAEVSPQSSPAVEEGDDGKDKPQVTAEESVDDTRAPGWPHLRDAGDRLIHRLQHDGVADATVLFDQSAFSPACGGIGAKRLPSQALFSRPAVSAGDKPNPGVCDDEGG